MFTCGETANGPRRIWTSAVVAATQSPLPASDTPPDLPKRIPVALALAVERVAVPILAIAVAADIRLAQRYHLRDLPSETNEAALRDPVALATTPHRIPLILAVAAVHVL